MYKLRIIGILLSTILLSSCSDFNEYAKETGKCRLVAELLEDKKAVMIIDKKFASYIKDHEDEITDITDPNELKKEVVIELGLNKPLTIFTAFRMTKTYNQCVDLHEQPKRPAPSFFYYIFYPFI